MPWIYHEKQDAALCGVHCLNNLLQGQFYTEIDLARIAHDLDDNERALMAEMGTDTKDFLKFMQEDSGNVADDGNYSVQVLSHALDTVWGVSLSSITHEDNAHILANPLGQEAFVCNLQSHWFAIRKIDGKWYNLNSLNKRPEFLGDVYLSAFLKQLELEGYSIFITRGTFPPPQKDSTTGVPFDKTNWMLIADAPAQQQKFSGQGHRLGGAAADDDGDFERAIKLSMQQSPDHAQPESQMSEEEMLALAIAESLSQPGAQPSDSSAASPSAMKISEEPSQDTDPAMVTKIVVRLADGSRLERRFLRTDDIASVYAWLASRAVQVASHVLVSSFPKKEFPPSVVTLADAGLAPSALLSLVGK
eukprot:TRINITY_DN1516_c0_g2_i1.p1 TRINITY_DN1516_c0_g2~~TRINITY_DN1516_c0_g2_i1.p1  ORF type:complete len:362 (+),score=51.88 TRINITY_DN1516_c0_g2_i1:777-1862(+)